MEINNAIVICIIPTENLSLSLFFTAMWIYLKDVPYSEAIQSFSFYWYWLNVIWEENPCQLLSFGAREHHKTENTLQNIHTIQRVPFICAILISYRQILYLQAQNKPFQE